MTLDYTIKKQALDNTKELMVAKMSSSTIQMEEKTGKNVSDFMKEVYNGFLALYEDVYQSSQD